MPTVSTVSFQGGDVQGLISLVIVFMALLMSASIGTAALFDTYRSRFGIHGRYGGSSRPISDAPIETGTGAGGLPDTARAMLEARRAASKTQGMLSRGGGSEGAEAGGRRVRHPLRTVSDVEPWKFAVSFVATAGLGAVAYALGEVSFGSELVLVLASLAVFFLGAVLLSGGFTSLRTYHAVRETPTTEAAEVSTSETGETVEMYGNATVSDHGTHKAPFTDEECLVCEYEIVEKPGEDEVADSGTAGMPFYLDDGTGKVLVDPDKARLKVALDTEVEVESQEPPAEITGGYVDVGVNEVESEYRERYVKPGENVYVYGDAVASDEHDVVINRKDEDSLFMIADSSEGELRKSLLSKAAARGTTGTVLMSVGLGVVFWLSGVSVV